MVLDKSYVRKASITDIKIGRKATRVVQGQGENRYKRVFGVYGVYGGYKKEINNTLYRRL